MKTKFLLPFFALTAYSSLAYSEEFASQQFNLDGTTVQYLNFSLAQDSVVDIAASSGLMDTELFLFQGTQADGLNVSFDDDSCLSVDCGLVGDYQFNPLIDDKSLLAGNYTVAIGASELTEAEAREGSNQATAENNAINSTVLLKVGDQNLIKAGTGLGDATAELTLNSMFVSLLGSAETTDAETTVSIGDNLLNTAQTVFDICSAELAADQDNSCAGFSDATPREMHDVMDALAPEELSAVASSSVATSKSSNMGVNARLSGLKSGYVGGLSVSGIAVSGGGAGDDTLMPKFGVFINGEGGFGDKQRTRNEVGYSFQSGGLTIGIDTALNENSVVGIAFNYSHAENSFSGQTGGLKTDSYTGSLYGSYYLDNFYIDGIFSVGGTDMNLSRQLAYTTKTTNFNETALGQTTAIQYLTSVNIGYQYTKNALSITPSIGINYVNTQVDAYSETGSRLWNIAYQNQEIESLTTTVGTQIAYVFSLPWGILTPQIQGEWLHEFSYDSQSNQVSFEWNPNKTFIIQSDIPDRDYFKIGFNVAAQFKQGFSGFVAYNSIVGRDYVTNHSFSTGLRMEF